MDGKRWESEARLLGRGRTHRCRFKCGKTAAKEMEGELNGE